MKLSGARLAGWGVCLAGLVQVSHATLELGLLSGGMEEHNWEGGMVLEASDLRSFTVKRLSFDLVPLLGQRHWYGLKDKRFANVDLRRFRLSDKTVKNEDYGKDVSFPLLEGVKLEDFTGIILMDDSFKGYRLRLDYRYIHAYAPKCELGEAVYVQSGTPQKGRMLLFRGGFLTYSLGYENHSIPMKWYGVDSAGAETELHDLADVSWGVTTVFYGPKTDAFHTFNKLILRDETGEKKVRAFVEYDWANTDCGKKAARKAQAQEAPSGRLL